jgi:hypothetical protein
MPCSDDESDPRAPPGRGDDGDDGETGDREPGSGDGGPGQRHALGGGLDDRGTCIVIVMTDVPSSSRTVSTPSDIPVDRR